MTNSIQRKNIIWNMIGTGCYAFNSFFFLIIVTRLNGLSDAGIFTFSFSTAGLLMIVGVYSGRVYQVSDFSKKFSDSDYVYHKIITCILMIIIAFGYCVMSGYNTYKATIFMLLVMSKVLEAFSEVLYAIIQKEDRLYQVGFSLFLKSILGLIAFMITDVLSGELLLSCLSLVVVFILVLVIYDLPMTKKCNKKFDNWSIKKTLLIFKFGFYTFAFTFMGQYVINASRYAIDGKLSEELQAIFGIILMPATIIILFGQFLIHPFLLGLANKFNSNDISGFISMLIKIILVILVFGIVSLTIAYFCGIPLFELVYSIELEKYLPHLLLIIAGAILYGVALILSTALTTMRYTFVQFVIYALTSLFAFFTSAFLVSTYGVYGASLAYFITMIFEILLYVIVFISSMCKIKEKIRNE